MEGNVAGREKGREKKKFGDNGTERQYAGGGKLVPCFGIIVVASSFFLNMVGLVDDSAREVVLKRTSVYLTTISETSLPKCHTRFRWKNFRQMMKNRNDNQGRWS